MTTEEKIEFIISLSGETDEAVVSAYLDLAEEIARGKVFPFGYTDEEKAEEIMSKYGKIVCEIAVTLLARRGAEGEKIHSESTAERTYENGGVPDSILKKLISYCGVV